MPRESRRIAEALRAVGEGLLVVLTGAGVSAASGVPTFRGPEPDAIWARDVTEIATARFLEESPVAWWRWYLRHFDGLSAVVANEAHRAVAAIERWQRERGEFLLITQNIDTLHEAAGSRELVKVHGTADRLRCTRPGCLFGAPRGSLPLSAYDLNAFRREPDRVHLPQCPACGSPLRPHVLLFDEYYADHEDYAYRRVEESFGRMAAILFVGTSFSVGITDFALRAARSRGIPAFSVDPHGAEVAGVVQIRARAEVLLPRVARAL